jgi:hypothetical protein
VSGLNSGQCNCSSRIQNAIRCELIIHTSTSALETWSDVTWAEITQSAKFVTPRPHAAETLPKGRPYIPPKPAAYFEPRVSVRIPRRRFVALPRLQNSSQARKRREQPLSILSFAPNNSIAQPIHHLTCSLHPARQCHRQRVFLRASLATGNQDLLPH